MSERLASGAGILTKMKPESELVGERYRLESRWPPKVKAPCSPLNEHLSRELLWLPPEMQEVFDPLCV